MAIEKASRGHGLQPYHASVYGYLDERLGERFTLENADVLAKSAWSTMQANWPGVRDTQTWSSLISRGQDAGPDPARFRLMQPLELPPLEPGELRPIVATRPSGRTARSAILRLLLYTDRIVIEDAGFYPDNLSESRYEMTKYGRRGLETYWGWIAAIRPLVETGNILLVGPDHEGALGPDDAIRDRVPIRTDTSLRMLTVWEALGKILGDSSNLELRAAAISLCAMSDNVATPLALNMAQRDTYRRVLALTTVDTHRTVRAETLARIDLPDFSADLDTLIALRQNEEAFTRWRGVLMQALQQTQDLPPDETAARKIRAIIGNELDGATRDLDRRIARSSALSMLRSGVREASYALLGAGAAAATLTALGAPVLGAAGALAGGLTTGAVRAAATVREEAARRESDRLVRQIALDFVGPEGK